MNKYIIVFFCFILLSCNKETSIQQYFVDKQNTPNFVSFDVAPSILNIEQNKLSKEQKAALNSFEKINVLAFKINSKNKAVFEKERNKVAQILKDEKYQELIKVRNGKQGASLRFVGDEKHIDEFIFYANKNENGFAIVRILGNDMNPSNVANMISLLSDANIDKTQIEPILNMLKK